MAALNEAISALTSQGNLAALTIKTGMTNACKDHVADMASGATGSTGTSGSTPATRIDKYALVTTPS